MRDLENERESLDQQLNSLEKMCERLENEKGALEAEENDKIKEQFEEEARVKQLQRKMKSEEAEYNNKSQHLEVLKKDIEKSNKKLGSTRPTIEVRARNHGYMHECKHSRA